MNILSRILILLAVLNTAFANEPPKGASLQEINCLVQAINLTDFPIPHEKLNEYIFGDLRDRVFGSWGSERTIPGHNESTTYWIWILTDPDNPSGFYSVRLNYGKPDGIDSIEVLYTSQNRFRFVYEASPAEKLFVPKLKKEMRERGLTPRAMAKEIEARREEHMKSWKDEEKRLKALPDENAK